MHPLTDAFIKGRSKYKKIRGQYYDGKKSACHLGCILLENYKEYFDRDAYYSAVTALRLDYPYISGNTYVPIPCEHTQLGHGEGGNITSILIHLNDEHDGRQGWGDKQIAGWLEKALTQAQHNPT